MPESYASYRKAMNDAWHGWWVTWPLSHRVRVGDAFDTSGDTLRSAGSLADRSITFEVVAPAPPADFTYDSGGSAKVEFKLAGASATGFSMLTEADAGALVNFAGSSSALVLYTGLTQAGMRDIRAVATDLVRRYWSGVWPEDLVGVTDVVSAAGATVLAAAGSDASAELRATAALGAGPLSLAEISGRVAVARSTNLGLQWTGTDVTPFFRVFRLHVTWLGDVKAEYGPRQPGRGAAPESVPPILLEEAADDPSRVIEPVAASEQPATWQEGSGNLSEDTL